MSLSDLHVVELNAPILNGKITPGKTEEALKNLTGEMAAVDIEELQNEYYEAVKEFGVNNVQCFVTFWVPHIDNAIHFYFRDFAKLSIEH